MARILVVDDSETDRHFVGSVLSEGSAHTVSFAANGREALVAAQQEVPDLIVTDLFMPECDGLELVSTVRRDFPTVPIVLITSQGSEELAAEALHRGAASYVPKRMVDRYLAKTIGGLLNSLREQHQRVNLLGRMESETCDFSLENDVSLVSALVGYVLESMSHIGIGDDVARMRAGVALEEALVNAIYHGNLEVDSELRQRDDDAFYALINERRQQPPYCHRRVQVRVTMSPSKAEFVVRDDGPGFQVATLPDPTDPENLAKASGRGVMLMRSFMDEVSYNAKGNAVTMVKRADLVS